MTKLFAAIVLSAAASSSDAFAPPAHHRTSLAAKISRGCARTSASQSPSRCTSSISLSAEASVASGGDSSTGAASSSSGEPRALTKQQKRAEQIRREGGPLAFNTKYGALNPYAIYYGLVSIGLGLVWFVALTLSQLFYKVTGGRLDRRRRIPVFCSHVWGTLLMLFTGCFPRIENGEIIKEFHKRYVDTGQIDDAIYFRRNRIS